MQHFEVDKYVRPCPGYQVGGDTALIQEHHGGLFLAIVDVLGHGLEAHDLALTIEAFLLPRVRADVAGLMKDLHAHIRGSRGACAGFCYIEPGTGLVRYTGIGDTVFRRFGEHSGHLPSWDGIIGHAMRSPREEQLRLVQDDVLVLYTDGVRDHFGLNDYPTLLQDSAQTIAHTVVDQFGRTYDDAACIALRYQPSKPTPP